jgi:hypothetical protein
MSNTPSNSARRSRPDPRKSPHPSSAPVSGITRFRREHPILGGLVPLALVIVVLVTLVAIKATGGSSGAAPAASKVVAGNGGSASSGSSTGASALPAGVLSDATSVSAATLAAIGEPSGSASPSATGAKTTLTAANGKPEILFIGAEYCPYCAAQRWALVVALSQFGTFSGLTATHSSTTDVFPDTKTFSFYGSTYTSTSLDFTSVELESNQVSGNSYATLQTPTAAEAAVFSKYDAAPYSSEPGSIPFLDIGNKYVSVGAGFTPQVLQGLSMQQIASQLNNKNSQVATAVDGEANRIIAAITAATGVKPNSASSTAATAAPATPATPATPASPAVGS